jgi:hypothetical protein
MPLKAAIRARQIKKSIPRGFEFLRKLSEFLVCLIYNMHIRTVGLKKQKTQK